VSAFGQEQRLRIHQVREDDDLVVLHADILQALAHGVDADALQRVGERSQRMRIVQVVVDLVERRLARLTVLELERADARLDRGRRA
jgi:hypothetical protein